MSKTFPIPKSFEEGPAPEIELIPVDSNQVAAIGYLPDTQELAVTFKRGSGAVYVYPNVGPETHAAFMAAESKGVFHGQHVKALPFRKYRAEAELPKAA